VTTILSEAQQNATNDATTAQVESICLNATRNSSETENCQEFANKLASVLVGFLEEVVDAEKVCALAELC
jgi:hypothetical protein